MDRNDVLSTPVAPCHKIIHTPYTGEAVARGEASWEALGTTLHEIDHNISSRISQSVSAGVFAARKIARGELVEAAHCIFISRQEYTNHLRQVRAAL